MGRILCLDIGTRRTGVAVSDETRTIAQGLETIEHKTDDRLVEQVALLAKQHEAEKLVIGLPLSLSGKPSARSQQVTQLANRLRNKLKLPVELADERYTTTDATEVLAESRARDCVPGQRSAGRSRKNKLAANRIAATIILEEYLARESDPSSEGSTKDEI